MKKIIGFFCLTLFLSLATSVIAEETTSRFIKTAAQPRAETLPSRSAATDLKAQPAVAASAACCMKQCGDGGNCGQDCTVVDSLSQCGKVNFKFECGANQGLSCLGDDCSCN